MEVPRSVIDGYDETVRTAVAAIQNELKASLSLIDYSAPIEQIRTEVVALMDAYCGAGSSVGARISSEFYNGLRQMVTGSDSTLSLQSGRDPKATERAVRAFVQKLVDGEDEDAIDAFEDLLLERVEYEAKRAIAYNTIDNVRRDPDKPRFARVPQGEKTCDFCLMLASRGPVYLTAESAGAFTKFHAHCDCKVVPFWDTVEDGTSRRRGLGMSIEGYDPDALYEQYQAMMKDPHSTFADRMAKGAERAKARRKSNNEDHNGLRAPSSTRESNAKAVGIHGGTTMTRARMRTGSMSSEEYAQFKRELEQVQGKREIRLPSNEYAMVMHELNTNLTEEDKKHAKLFKPIRNHCYTILNLGDGAYRIVNKTPLD